MTIQEWLAENIGCPCDYTPLDEYMFDYCGKNCEECTDNDKECWDRVIKAYGIINVTKSQTFLQKPIDTDSE